MRNLHVLAVDDEKGMRSGIERTLGTCRVPVPDADTDVGLDVHIVETGEAAVRHIGRSRPDILLLDYKLPGIDGLEVLRQTADAAGDMLTIMITAYASIEAAIAATKQGAYDFLPKPFTPADLRHAVRKAATRILLARRARQLEAEKRHVRFEFIRVLGHELKAPLGAVGGYLYLLRDRTLGNSLEPYAKLVDRSLLRIDQMTKLIHDLLDMTRIESGQMVRKLERVDLVPCAREALEIGREEAGRRNIVMEVQAPETLCLQADRGEIGMVLNNLVSNAVKYNRDGGRVTIRLAQAPGGVTLSVADTGIGMTDDEKQKLFGEFVRIKNAKTRHTLGSGLGLSILKRVVELYAGTIAVESTPDVGSTFTVTLMDGPESGSGAAGEEP